MRFFIKLMLIINIFASLSYANDKVKEKKGNTMKICIIDDNLEILDLLKNILDATGNDVFTADNGKDGLSLILSENFDLIVLDITMPDFSGIDVVRYLDINGKLRENHILFLTAAAVPDFVVQEWLDKGVNACLKKPVEFDVIFEHVTEARPA